MKRTILVILMVALIATPCFAQEIEPEGIFSIEGTLWGVDNIFPRHPYSRTEYMGFSKGAVYGCSSTIDCRVCYVEDYLSYLDLFWVGLPSIIYGFTKPLVITGWALPILGVGVMTTFNYTFPLPGFQFLTKVSDSWSPPPRCMCRQSGGIVETRLCCEAVEDYPNLCLVGACTCTPENSHEVLVCQCPEGFCWNGVDGGGCIAE